MEAKKLGLVDRIGGIREALACAARLAKVSEYRLREYPAVKDRLSRLMKDLSGEVSTKMVKRELGVNYELYRKVKELKELQGEIQARMPFKYSF
jgi:protease-4